VISIFASVAGQSQRRLMWREVPSTPSQRDSCSDAISALKSSKASDLNRLQGPLLHRTQVSVGSGAFNVIASRPLGVIARIVHFSHGFGANGLSFQRLMSHLAHSQSADVLCTHDIAGFGQSEPPQHEHEYTLSYDGQHVSPAVVERVCSESARIQGDCSAASPEVVFCGHSMGAVSALFSAKEWMDRGMRARACVLIAPAVVCTPGGRADRFTLAAGLAVRILFWLLAGVHALRPLGAHVLRGALYLLVSSVPRFWHWGLRVAYAFAPGLPTPQTVAQYESASRRVAWAHALLTFLEANLWPSHHHAKPAMAGPVALPELIATLHAAGTQILIVHDEGDPIVPIANSRRLLAALPPGVATLEVVHGSGHMPHETDVAAFAALLAKHGVLEPSTGE